MTTVITRYYATEDKAKAAVAKLDYNKFYESEYSLLTGADEAALKDAGVYPAGARALAAKLAEGGAALVIRAPWGRAKQAIAIADKAGPTDIGLRHADLYQESSSHWRWETRQLPDLVNYTVASGGLFPPALTRSAIRSASARSLRAASASAQTRAAREPLRQYSSTGPGAPASAFAKAATVSSGMSPCGTGT